MYGKAIHTLRVSLAVAGALWLVHGSQALGKTIARDLPTEGLEQVEIILQSGEVEVVQAASGGKVTVDLQDTDHCTAEVRAFNPKTFMVQVSPKGWFGGHKCPVAVHAQLPRGIGLKVMNNFGNLTAEVSGAVDFNVRAGDVAVSGAPKSVVGKVASGTVHLAGLQGGGHLKLGSGHVDVTLAEVPSRGELRIATGNGPTVVRVPQSTRLQVDATTAFGTIDTSYVDASSSAGFRIAFKGGNSSLRFAPLDAPRRSPLTRRD